MPILDFKEIPEAHIASGEQDRFELFARDFLEYLGYRIISSPDRGADGGKDIVVEEKRVGVGGENYVRWLVSCKHKAHSGSSVKPTDESNIRDRVDANKCSGFIGFYSTLPSTGLAGIIAGISDKIETQTFDKEKIEGNLLGSTKGFDLAKRYFPESIKKWQVENPAPVKIFAEDPILKCAYCNKDLLNPNPTGIIVFWERIREDYEKEPQYYEHIYWCCKGHCDKKLSFTHRNHELIDGWEDIPDVMIPHVYIKWVMTSLNELRAGTKYSDEAYSKFKYFLLNIYPFVSRHLSAKEKERLNGLMEIPSYLGGMGY
ncbi:MAG: restriction endonuclease [Desulfuromonadaceae bacterium]|nr:restriction endonuclease [Desulfuromonadaceae bacterium]